MAGCTTSLAKIDAQIEERLGLAQSTTLGENHVNDPRRVPLQSVGPAPGERAYLEKIESDNPSAADLPVSTGPPLEYHEDGTPVSPRMLSIPADAPRYDLQRIVAYAIANSREYRNSKETLFIAVISLLSEEHLWGPRFFDTVRGTFSGTPEGGDHDQVLTLINELSVTQRLPYGGSVSASAVVDYTTLLRDATGAGEGQGASLSLSADLPLLRNAGQTARESLIQARRNLIYATRTFERFRRSFLLQIATDYFDLIRQQKTLENLERQVGNFEWLIARIEALAKAGRVALFEVQRVQQQVLFARNNLLNTQERYAAQLDAFKIQIGMDVDEPIVIDPTDLVIVEPALDIPQGVRTALDLRLDLQTSFDQVDDARRRAKNAANQKLPDLDLFADVTISTDAEKKNAGVDFDLGDSSYSAGFELGLPLDRRVEELDYRRALIDVERAYRSYTLLRDQIAQSVRSSIRGIEQARFSLDLQTRNVAIAEKFKQGVLLRLRSLGPRDFIEAQEDLLEAENRRDVAERDLRVSVLRYLLDTGQMRVTADGAWQTPARLVPEGEKLPTMSESDTAS